MQWDVEQPAHPLQRWLDQEKLNYDGAAKRCRKLGTKIGADYLKQVAQGYYCPSYRVAAFLAQRLCAGSFTVDEIASFPYSIRRCTWAA
jgi:hypothetical protein